ncbi:MAG: hypothetical protein LBS19_05840 [Clostridiales bacterium]|jgi:hypothetical protein|nr:hypothetical protein [Clostridiales bacterium]
MESGTVIIILVVVGLYLAQMFLRRVMKKGTNAVERAIRSDSVKKETDLLGAAVFFETSAPLANVRRAIDEYVPVIDKVGHKMKVLEDSASGISWAIGLPRMSEGAVATLRYKDNTEGTLALFEVTQHVTRSAVSPFIKQLTELRGQVIAAFEHLDTNVGITTDTREVKQKMSWF